MNQFSMPAASLTGAAARLSVLRFVADAPDKDLLDTAMMVGGVTPFLSIVGEVSTSRGTPLMNWYACYTGSETYLFIGGVKSALAAREIWDAYVGDLLGFPRDGKNAVFEDAARYIFALTPATYWSLADNLWVCGYSAGGAVGYRFRARNESESFSPWSGFVSFGSPKPDGLGQGSASGYSDKARFFNSNDAVPLIPPTVSAYQRIVTLGISAPQGNRISSFGQSANGIQLNADGSTEARERPGGVDINEIAGIQTWMRAAEIDQDNPHSLRAYIGRVNAALAVAPRQQQVAPSSSGGDWNAPISDSTIRRQIEAIQTQFNATYPSTSAPSVVIPSVQQFRAVRKNRSWYVYFGSIIIATAPHKKGARQLARSGNAFLRSLQARGLVNASALSDRWVQYLADASDPSSGFEPQLVTA